uniref:ceramide glucosyltransferase n=1 Tax=Timema bartmani TaxID=61472 RepID=A0A7R9FBL7_9NEOP|nr:unnamed protein product [Timema bartmani]
MDDHTEIQLSAWVVNLYNHFPRSINMETPYTNLIAIALSSILIIRRASVVECHRFRHILNHSVSQPKPRSDLCLLLTLWYDDDGTWLYQNIEYLVKEDTLLDMVLHMTEFIGLVHQMPFTCDRKGFAATLEKIYFGTAQARIYLSADFLGIICHTGMSTLMRKSLIDDVGGLAKFGCYLAEDFFFAKSLTNRGWKMRISSQPAWQNSGLCEISSFQARLTRWAKLRVAMVPFTIILEPLSECMVLGAFASWAVSFLFNWDPLSFYLVHILLWFICDWILISIVQNGSLPFNKFDFVVGWLFHQKSFSKRSPMMHLHQKLKSKRTESA